MQPLGGFQPISFPARQPPGSSYHDPIYFTGGPFQGRTVRSRLYELQKADLGRKYAKVDRRPLDPPPVVVLKLSEIQNAHTDHATEVDLTTDQAHIYGFLCTVDLFPVPGPESSKGLKKSPSSPSPSSSNQTQFTMINTQASFSVPLPSSAPPPPFSYVPEPSMQFTFPAHPSPPMPYPPGDIVHHVDGHPIRESSKMTQALVGSTFVQPTIVDWQGESLVMFVFSDLAVKTEGSFTLRYRVFDLYSRSENSSDHRVVQGECYGGVFRVYSTKEFPGLRASTELTKRLSMYGVRLNIRENERRRRRKDSSPGSVCSAGSKRKRPAEGDEDSGQSEDDD